MKKYIFIVLLIGMAAFAQAQTNRWKPIYTDDKGTTTYIDTRTASRNGVWSILVGNNSNYNPNENTGGSYAKIHTRIKCRQRQFATTFFAFYDEEQEERVLRNQGNTAIFHDVIPDSEAERMLEYICRRYR